jgi:hypothetical protein
MIKRHPDAIVTAHLMDRSRKELYVEGARDRLFLSWLLGQRLNANASIREVSSVELPAVEGGERGRIIHFAEILGEEAIQLRMFADADWDRILGRTVPWRVWLTDSRDMEGYVLREECLSKTLSLGVGTERVSAARVLLTVRAHGRTLGAIRLMSELDSLNLPFQKTCVEKYMEGKAGEVALDLKGYLRALLQNAHISLARLQELQERVHAVEALHDKVPDSEMIHGKDALAIVAVLFSEFGLDRKECERLLWTSFEACFVETGSALDVVTRFLQ